MKIGDLVRYASDKNCIGVVVAIGSNMLKIKWENSENEEWMPAYALEVIK